MRRSFRFAPGLAVSLATLAAAAPAHAGLLVSSAPSCSQETLSQRFLAVGDTAHYTPVPGGTFETGAPGWKLSGGAVVTSGNETSLVANKADSHSLALPDGSSATSASVCVGINAPTLRFVARNGGLATSTLTVSVLFEDSLGLVHSLPISTVVSGSSWSPTLPIPILVNLLPLLPNNETAIAFQFTPVGLFGGWHIDDVYIDPWGKG